MRVIAKTEAKTAYFAICFFFVVVSFRKVCYVLFFKAFLLRLFGYALLFRKISFKRFLD